eukprot:TRINITY_DN17007_c0_g4_i1.p1 TRINITY_DN17007_c0_g4~~TRINITY_DN17007_c0_g4_i1.p1  ORF type:complete len:494 (+),score=73.70 TRINITY_DN17007_c0_g4_i1:200-1483(+)
MEALDMDGHRDLGVDADAFGTHGLGLQGDFYFQPDDVKRGVTVPADGANLFGTPAFDAKGLDPYGCGLGLDDCGQGSSWYGDGLQGGLQVPTLSRDSPFQVSTGATFKAPPVGSFVDTVAPAQVPFGGVSATSLTFDGVTAAEVMNCVHAFLDQLPSTSFQKVRLEKFAINAEVFREAEGRLIGGSCSLKARVFSARGDGAQVGQRSDLKLEFRRRGGDALNYAHVFDEAQRFLQQRLGAPREATQSPFEEIGAPEKSPLDGIGEPAEDISAVLQPLLDALCTAGRRVDCDATPSQASEAVASLAALAGTNATTSAALAASLDQAHEALSALLQSESVTDAYPAARLASGLARYSECEMADPLLQVAFSGVAAAGTDRLVRVELAEALRSVALRSTAPKSPLLRDQLAVALQSMAAPSWSTSILCQA